MTDMNVVPLDISLARVGEDIVVNLFCIDEHNNTICIQDASYQNYFHIIVEKHSKELEKQLKEIVYDKYAVTAAERTTPFYFGEVNAYKVTVNHIHATKVIAAEVIKLQPKLKTLHVDIPFVKKYVMDHKIEFLKKATVDITPIDESEYLVPTYKLNKIKQTSQPIDFKSLHVLGFDIETYASGKRIDTINDPIIMVGFHDGTKRTVFTWGRYKSELDFVTTFKDEAEMLNETFKFIQKTKPHIITGYNSDSFDFSYVKDRCDVLKIKPILGLDNSELRFSSGNQQFAFINGMPHIDMYNFIRTNLRQQLKTNSLSLSNVSKELLGDDKIDVDIMGLFKSWDDNDTAKLDVYAEYNAHDSKLCVDLFENLFANITEFSNMIHFPLQDLTRMSYSQLVESYLMTRATEQNVLIPNKPDSTETNLRLSKPQNIGAFVFKPTPGFYEHVVVFDFRSLYPSIIASLNIDRAAMSIDRTNQVPEFEEPLSFDLNAKSFIPGVIGDIVKRRDDIKITAKKITDPHEKALAKARIYNLKILANSMYGYLSFARARWYHYEGGGATTAYARHYIKKTIAESEKAGLKVLYGDTDSVFLELRSKTVEEAFEFVKQFNTTMPGIIELQFEDNFETGIFVGTKSGTGGAKKRYALYDKDTDKFKIAGLEYVRTDWSDIARETQYVVLEKILKEKDPHGALAYVRDTIAQMNAGTIPAKKFILTNKLSRELDQYESNLPHVVLARELRLKGERIHSRSKISYVVNVGKGPIFERVTTPEDVIKLDMEYYIHNQVIPAVKSILAIFNFTEDDIMGKTVQGGLGDFM